MEIVDISPRGYCYGVVEAMTIARNAALDESLPRPIYILGMIVHNQHITKAYESIGIHTLDGSNRADILSQIDQGTVIFTAHGTAPAIKKAAQQKGLVTIDATCPDVQITHEQIATRVAAGYDVIYIGKAGHPEPEGAIGIAPDKIHLVSSQAEAETLNLSSSKIFVTNQTTMSQWDIREIMDALRVNYPQAIFHKEVCQATQVRQQAVVEQAQHCDLTLVVGDPRSNNSNRLAQVSEKNAGVKAYRIADVSEIQLDWLTGVKKVAITAGASTPTQIVREVSQFLKAYDPNVPATWERQSAVTSEMILPPPRYKDLQKGRARKLEKLRQTQLNDQDKE